MLQSATSGCCKLLHGVLRFFIVVFKVYMWLLFPCSDTLLSREIKLRRSSLLTIRRTVARETPASLAIVDILGQQSPLSSERLASDNRINFSDPGIF